LGEKKNKKKTDKIILNVQSMQKTELRKIRKFK